jgi:hypothetical protein
MGSQISNPYITATKYTKKVKDSEQMTARFH